MDFLTQDLLTHHAEAETRSVRLDQHDSVRSHVHRRLNEEVAQLERRIATLRLARTPHAAIMISAYERMIDRKIGFMESWGFRNR